MKKFIAHNILGLLFVFLVSYGLIRPLMGAGYFPMHDDAQIGRVVAMGKAIRWGQFPVRWVSDLGYGYGYPLFNFYGPLPYYAGGALYALGVNGLVSTKIMMAMGMILSGLTLYLFLRTRLGQAGALVAAVFYMYAPYHAVQLYVRGAVGELWTLIFYPMILWGFMSEKKGIIGSIGLAGVILSHTLLGYATVVVLVLSLGVYWIVKIIQKKFNLSLFIFHFSLLALGLGLSAFFWLPAISEMHFTNVAGQISSTADFRDHFVCLAQLWSSPWGFAGSAKGCADGMSFMIGKLHIILALLGACYFTVTRKIHNVVIFGCIIAAIGLALLLGIGRPLWEILPFFSYVQYPWRFFVYVMFGLSITAGAVVYSVRHQLIRWLVATILIICAIGYYGKWFVPQYLYVKNPDEFESKEELRFRISKVSDEYMTPGFVAPKSENGFVRDTISASADLSVASMVETDLYSRFDLESSDEKFIEVKKMYFPGFVYWVNGKVQNPEVSGGVVSLLVPKGKSVVEIRFTNTPVRTISNGISLIVLFYILSYYGKNTKKTIS